MRKLTYEYVKEKIETDGYILLSDTYKNNSAKLEVQCPKGHTYSVCYGDWSKGRRCPHCHGRDAQRLTLEYVKEKIEQEGYIMLSDTYKNAYTKLIIQCNEGHEPYSVCWHDWSKGTRCPHCNSSKGEKRILEYLISNNVNYISQYKFEDCKDSRPLPFDFYLPDYNICIEYDGEQHFHPVDFTSKGIEKAEELHLGVKKRDEIKTQYCEDNNIELLRIPYWNYSNIKEILENKLKINKETSTTKNP